MNCPSQSRLHLAVVPAHLPTLHPTHRMRDSDSVNEDEFGDPLSLSLSSSSAVSNEVLIVPDTAGSQSPAIADGTQFAPQYAACIEDMISRFLRETENEANWAHPRLVAQDTLEVAVSTRSDAPFCFRIVAQLKGGHERAFQLMASLPRRPEWDAMCESADVIEQIDPLTAIYHLRLRAVWPTAARDACLLIAFRRLADGRFVSVSQSIDDSRCPPDATGKTVRMHTRLAGNLFAPLQPASQNRFSLVQLADADPGGFIPSALVKRVSTKSFPATMARIEAAVATLTDDDFYEKTLETMRQHVAPAAPELPPATQQFLVELHEIQRRLEAIDGKLETASSPLKLALQWSPLLVSTALLYLLLRQHHLKQ